MAFTTLRSLSIEAGLFGTDDDDATAAPREEGKNAEVSLLKQDGFDGLIWLEDSGDNVLIQTGSITDETTDDGDVVFRLIPSEFIAGTYYSLTIGSDTITFTMPDSDVVLGPGDVPNAPTPPEDIVTRFTALSDTPAALEAGKWLQVNSEGTALIWVDAPSGGGGTTPANRLVPAGGSIGQVLTKDTNTDYDVSWGAGPRSRQSIVDLLTHEAGGDIDFTRRESGNSSNLRGEIRAGAVGTPELADNAVTADKVAAGVIPTATPSNRLVPSGGTSGQVLKKDSGTDYDVSWQDDEEGSGGSGGSTFIPPDQATIQGTFHVIPEVASAAANSSENLGSFTLAAGATLSFIAEITPHADNSNPYSVSHTYSRVNSVSALLSDIVAVTGADSVSDASEFVRMAWTIRNTGSSNLTFQLNLAVTGTTGESVGSAHWRVVPTAAGGSSPWANAGELINDIDDDSGGSINFTMQGSGATANLRGTVRANVIDEAELVPNLRTAVGRIPSAPTNSEGNKVWKTASDGTPGWRDDVAGGGVVGVAGAPQKLTIGLTSDLTVASSATAHVDVPLDDATLGTGTILSGLNTSADTVECKAGSYLIIGILDDMDTGNDRSSPGLEVYSGTTDIALRLGPAYARGSRNLDGLDITSVFHLPADGPISFKLSNVPAFTAQDNESYDAKLREVDLFPLGLKGDKGDPGADGSGGGGSNHTLLLPTTTTRSSRYSATLNTKVFSGSASNHPFLSSSNQLRAATVSNAPSSTEAGDWVYYWTEVSDNAVRLFWRQYVDGAWRPPSAVALLPTYSLTGGSGTSATGISGEAPSTEEGSGAVQWIRDTPYPYLTLAWHAGDLWLAMQDVPEGQGEPGTTATIGYWDLIGGPPAFRIGEVRMLYYDATPISYTSAETGEYQTVVYRFLDESFVSGDQILVECGTTDEGAWAHLVNGVSAADPRVANRNRISDNYTILSLYADVTSPTLVFTGDVTGNVTHSLMGAWKLTGTSIAGANAMKAALAVAVEPEAFPPEFDSTRIYVPGEFFYYQNAVYKTLQLSHGRIPSGQTDEYYEKVLDAAGVSNTDIDARIADWAEEGSGDLLPVAKLPTIPVGNLPRLNARGGDNVSIAYAGDTHLSNLPVARAPSGNDTGSAGVFNKAQITKFAGIEEGAQANVPSDWDATSGDAEILNKPDIPDLTVSEWNSSTLYPIGKRVGVGLTTTRPRIFEALKENRNDDPRNIYSTNPEDHNWGEITGPHFYEAAPSSSYMYHAGEFRQQDGFLYQARRDTTTNPPESSGGNDPDWRAMVGTRITHHSNENRIVAYNPSGQVAVTVYTDSLRDRGAYVDGNAYQEGNTVLHNGIRWYCFNGYVGGSSGTEPGTNGGDRYWRIFTAAIPEAPSRTTTRTATLTTPSNGIRAWHRTTIPKSALTDGAEIAWEWPYTYTRPVLLWSRMAGNPTYVVPEDRFTDNIVPRSVPAGDYKTDGSVLYFFVGVHHVVDDSADELVHHEVMVAIDQHDNLALGLKAIPIGSSSNIASTISLHLRPWF